MEVRAGPRDLARLAFRVVAVCAGLGAVVQVAALGASYWASLQPGGSESDLHQWMIVAHTLSVSLWTLCTVVLWLGADWLARRLAPEQDPFTVTVDLADLRATAFAIVGLVWLGAAVTRLAQVAAQQFLEPQLESWERAQLSQDAAGAVAQLVLGVGLLLGAPRVWELLRALRKSPRPGSAGPPGS